MEASIYEYQYQADNHHLYDVNFYGDTIQTLVTTSIDVVDGWIDQIEYFHRYRLNRLVVGLDVEWRPNFRPNHNNIVATIQLCVGNRCLIFQILHAEFIPRSLAAFLENEDYTFVGVGIQTDVEKLVADYDLNVSRSIDLRGLAVENMDREDLRNAGLKQLSLEVLGKDVEKPRRVTMSQWDNRWLTPEQVQYACIDAFVSFEIGTVLQAWRCLILFHC